MMPSFYDATTNLVNGCIPGRDGELNNNHTMKMMRTLLLPNNKPDDDKDVDKGKDNDGQQRRQ